jgi:hypothetical protein
MFFEKRRVASRLTVAETLIACGSFNHFSFSWCVLIATIPSTPEVPCPELGEDLRHTMTGSSNAITGKRAAMRIHKSQSSIPGTD